MDAISKSSVIVKQYKNSLYINQDKLLISIVKKNETEILDVHRDQLRRGEFGDGKSPKYPAGYLNEKRQLSSYFSDPNTDLFVTGSFQESEYFKFSGSNWEIDSRDEKTAKLVGQYGETIFDLNPNSLELAHDIVTPNYNKEYHILLNK